LRLFCWFCSSKIFFCCCLCIWNPYIKNIPNNTWYKLGLNIHYFSISQFSLILSVFITVYNTFSDPISIFLFFWQVLKDQCKKLEVHLWRKRSPWDAGVPCRIERVNLEIYFCIRYDKKNTIFQHPYTYFYTKQWLHIPAKLRLVKISKSDWIFMMK
jgi:hypothetical protein